MQNEKEFELTKPILDTISTVFFNNSLSDIQSMAIYADIQLRLKNYRNAVVALKRIVTKDESNYPAFEQLVYALNILGKTDSVIYYSNIAIEKFDNNPVFYLFNGAAKFQNKDFSGAAAVLEKGLSNSKNKEIQLEFYSLLAECYESLGEHEKSDNAFNVALSLDRNNYGILNNYSYYLSLRSKNLAIARRMSGMTIKADPTNSTYLDTYAWILFKMNKWHKAEKIIKRAIEYGGENNKEILLHYSEILISLKRNSEALHFLNEAVKLANEGEKNEILEKIKLIEKNR
jgi:Tfp pilus assembly protein PilF